MRKITWYQELEGYLLLSALALMAGAALLFVVMCLYWLKVGAWPQWSASGLGFSPPETSLLGLNKILAEIYDLPIALSALLLGELLIGFFWLAGRLFKPR